MTAAPSTSPPSGGGGPDSRGQIDESQRKKLLDAALGYADSIREVIARTIKHGVDVDAKPDRSLVTNADLAAERAFRDQVERDFPDMGVIGEEFKSSRPDARYQWIIDPVDGTADFARGVPTWGSIIGLHLDGQPLVGVIDHPDLGLRVHAAYGLGAFRNGKRIQLKETLESRGALSGRIGLPSRSSFIRCSEDGEIFDILARAHPDFRALRTCLAHTYAATGQLDAAVEWDAHIWDLAATRIVVEEAGGAYICVRELERQGSNAIYSAVFGRPALVERIANLLVAHL